VSAVTAHLRESPLSVDALVAATERPDCGALATFVGTVRDHNDGRAVTHLLYTAHVPVAERLISEIEAEVRETFDVPECRVVHRLGRLEIGEAAIVAVVRSAHRGEAFDACRAVVEAVKHRVPIWKEEFFPDGTSAFVPGCSLLEDHDA
jgi:molybdopterin synthase catalytic subunit